MERNKYWFWLSQIPSIGCRTSGKLLAYFQDIEQLYNASETVLTDSGILTKAQTANLINSRKSDDLERMYEKMTDQDIRCISMEDEDYPQSLKALYDVPVALFVKGELPEQQEWLIAVVGARGCSCYGSQIARMISRGFACSGVSVVSGMARGIDSAAHWGALEGNGKTYAVLGCGADICYPTENMDLYAEIVSNGGVISEYPPGTPPEGWRFPMRNRLIAALSKGILVVEARRKSGALITVEQGLDLGKEIFAVPGRINDALSEGCNQLIKNGAVPVSDYADILNEFDITVHEYKKNNIKLDNSEKLVYASICLVPRSADEVASMTGMDIRNVVKSLISMELKGIINRVGKNQYILSV